MKYSTQPRLTASANGKLTIPKRPSTESAVGFNKVVASQVAKLTSINRVDEARRRLAAWSAYVNKREQRDEIEAATRWCEIRIGELLGNGEAAQKTGKRILSLAGERSSKDDRHKFRLLAEHRGLVVKLIDSGTVSRAQLLAAISKLKRRAKRSKHRASHQAAADPLPANDRWSIVLGDCIDELAKIDDGCAALAFCDSPYNIGLDYGDGKQEDQLSDGEYVDWAQSWMRQCYRVLTDNGSFWVMINDEYAGEFAVALKSIGFTIRNWIKWYEAFGVNCQNKFNRCSRHLFYAVKTADDFVFNKSAVSRPSDRQSVYKDKRANHHGKLWDDVRLIPRVTGTSKERLPEFPTQLPVELLRAIVGCSSNPGDLVIDPFNGSGTSGVAALELGRRYFGIEKNERWHKLAIERLGAISSDSN